MSYALDAAGNCTQRTSTLAPIPSASYAYNAADQVVGDDYDANGNTTSLDGATLAYDHANRLTSINGGAVTLIYDGDGALVGKTVGGVTTRYLVDDLNPSGMLSGGTWSTRYFGYDGQGHCSLQPAQIADPQKGPFLGVLQLMLFPYEPPQVIPAGATVCRPGFSPGRIVRLVKAHIITCVKNP